MVILTATPATHQSSTLIPMKTSIGIIERVVMQFPCTFPAALADALLHMNHYLTEMVCRWENHLRDRQSGLPVGQGGSTKPTVSFGTALLNLTLLP